MKKGIDLVLAMGGKPPEGDPLDSPADGPDMGLHAAADEILSAIDTKDAGALADALKAFCEQCSSYESGE